MADPIKKHASAIDIVHPKHGAAHCDKDQLADMLAEGWTVDKDGDGKKDTETKEEKSARLKAEKEAAAKDKDGDGKK